MSFNIQYVLNVIDRLCGLHRNQLDCRLVGKNTVQFLLHPIIVKTNETLFKDLW